MADLDNWRGKQLLLNGKYAGFVKFISSVQLGTESQLRPFQRLTILVSQSCLHGGLSYMRSKPSVTWARSMVWSEVWSADEASCRGSNLSNCVLRHSGSNVRRLSVADLVTLRNRSCVSLRTSPFEKEKSYTNDRTRTPTGLTACGPKILAQTIQEPSNCRTQQAWQVGPKILCYKLSRQAWLQLSLLGVHFWRGEQGVAAGIGTTHLRIESFKYVSTSLSH